MQTHELPSAAALLDQYLQHFAGTIAPRPQTPAREALRRVNCELGATRTTRPLRPPNGAFRLPAQLAPPAVVDVHASRTSSKPQQRADG